MRSGAPVLAKACGQPISRRTSSSVVMSASIVIRPYSMMTSSTGDRDDAVDVVGAGVWLDGRDGDGVRASVGVTRLSDRKSSASQETREGSRGNRGVVQPQGAVQPLECVV